MNEQMKPVYRMQSVFCFNFREIDEIKAKREQKKGNKEEVRMLKSILYQISWIQWVQT